MISASRNCGKRALRGFTLMELVVAATALGLLAVGILQGTLAIERARRATERVDYASRELDNLMERFVHQPWGSITQSAADRLTPDRQVTRSLPNVSLETLVMQERGPLPAKRITMQLRWHAHTNQPQQSLALTAWAFRPREDTP